MLPDPNSATALLWDGADGLQTRFDFFPQLISNHRLHGVAYTHFSPSFRASKRFGASGLNRWLSPPRSLAAGQPLIALLQNRSCIYKLTTLSTCKKTAIVFTKATPA